MLPNSGLDEMKQHHLQLGGFAPSVLLHWLQKEIPQDLVEFPFCFLHKKLSNRKLWSGETRYNLWISCYKWADKKFWLSSWMITHSSGSYEFIQQPLCMSLQTPQIYKGKTFPHIIIHRLHVWYLKHVQPLTSPTSCPSHLSCNKHIFPSQFPIACLLPSRLDYLYIWLFRQNWI